MWHCHWWNFKMDAETTAEQILRLARHTILWQGLKLSSSRKKVVQWPAKKAHDVFNTHKQAYLTSLVASDCIIALAWKYIQKIFSYVIRDQLFGHISSYYGHTQERVPTWNLVWFITFVEIWIKDISYW